MNSRLDISDCLLDLFGDQQTSETVRLLLINAWELGWQEGYQSPDLPADPDVPANASFMNPYRVEGVDA